MTSIVTWECINNVNDEVISREEVRPKKYTRMSLTMDLG